MTNYWLIIPDGIAFKIEEKCIEKEGEFKPEILKSSLTRFATNELKILNVSLYDFYRTEIKNLGSETIKRALNKRHPDNGVFMKNNNRLLDLLSWYAFTKSWKDVLSEFCFEEKNLEIRRVKNKKKIGKEILEFDNLFSQFNPKPAKREAVSYTYPLIYKNTELIVPETFDKEILSDINSLNKSTVDYYLKFNNSPTAIMRSVANSIYISPGEVFKFLTEQNIEELKIQDVLSRTEFHYPLLIKIMAIGGVGKSTLLWHFIKTLHGTYTCWYIKRVDIAEIAQILKTRTTNNQTPLLLFLDDAVTYDENRDDLLQLGELILQSSSENRIALVLSERAYRYGKFKNTRGFERNFSDSIYSIEYTSRPLRKQIFEKIFVSMSLNDENILEKSRDQYNTIFEETQSDSLIDSTFNLLVTLKNDFPKVGYRFDWEEWKEVCVDRFSIFYTLYKIVAFFYQFGVLVPFAFFNDYYKEESVNDLLRELLGTLNTGFCPIVIVKGSGEKEFLALRHEKLAEWYFQLTPGAKESARDFFLAFIENVRTPSYTYLLRNISRKNPEFHLSPYKNILSLKKLLDITNRYLDSVDTRNYTEEEYKMLMEKHFILKTMGNTEESLKPLETVLSLKEDSVFALSRLASCIKENDPKRAEELYKKIFEIDDTNYYALLGLFSIYFNKRNFISIQKTCFEYAKSDIRFGYRLIQFIDDNFDKLPQKTRSLLLELYEIYPVLGNAFAELLINKGNSELALEILLAGRENISQLSTSQQNDTIHLFIKLYELHTVNSETGLLFAEEILENKKDDINNSPISLFLKAKITALKHGREYYDLAEPEFLKISEIDKEGRIFYSISKFYRDYVKQILDTKFDDYPRATYVLLKAIKFAEGQLQNSLEYNQPKVVSEQAMFYNGLLNILYKHSKKIFDSSRKYETLIKKYENICLVSLEKSIEILTTKFKQAETGILSNWIPNDNEIGLLSKLCNIYHFTCKNISNRINNFKLNSAKTEDYLNIINKGQEAIVKALEWDDDNPNLIISLVDSKIRLKDFDTISFLENLTFERFSTGQKARFAKLLLKGGYTKNGFKLISTFGELNSPVLKTKNDLAYCYISAKLWSFASNILYDIEILNESTLDCISRLALEIPETDEERINMKIHFAELYCKNKSGNVKIYKRNICHLLFIKGEKGKAFAFFLRNRDSFDLNDSRASTLLSSFNNLSKDWQNDFVRYFSRILSVIEQKSTLPSYFGDVLDSVKNILIRLPNSQIKINTINFISKNEDEIKENVKGIVRRCIALLFKIVEGKTYVSGHVFNFTFDQVQQLDNDLFRKSFLHKLILSKSLFLLNFFKPILSYCEYTFFNDPEINGMLGTAHLIRGNFPQAKRLYLQVEKNAKNISDKYHANANIANWIITKIEKEGVVNFEKKSRIYKQINEAENRIVECQILIPEFKWQKELSARLELLKQKINIS